MLAGFVLILLLGPTQSFVVDEATATGKARHLAGLPTVGFELEEKTLTQQHET